MPDDVALDASLETETQETQPEGQGGAGDGASSDEMVQVSKRELESLFGRIDSFKKTQSTLSKKETDYQNTIHGLQVLSKFNELSDEDKAGVTSLAEMSREMATTAGKAWGLNASDVRYLSTLPWRQINAKAQEIASEAGGEGGGADDVDGMRAKYFGTGTQKRGSADAKLPETRGQRVNRGGYKDMNAVLDAAMNMPAEKAQELLRSHGISV